MKEGWEYKKLGEVCKINSGKSIKSNLITPTLSSDTFPCYGGNGIRGYVSSYSHDGVYPIVGRVGALCGNVHLAEGKFYATEHALVLTITSCSVSSNWLTLWLESRKLGQFAKGVAQPVLSSSELSKLPLSIPPLSQQQSIVAELDKINEIIDLKKAQLKDLDLLAQSIFYEMFGDPIENPKGWEVKKFRELFKLKSGDGLSAKAFIPGKFPVYGGNGISGYHNDFNKDGIYVIIGRVGALCGNVRMVEGQFWLTDNAFQLFYAEDNFDIVYLSNKLKLLNLRRFANAAAQPVISNSTLKDIDIILPPLSLQQSFASKIQAIESQKSAIKQSLAEVETLLASRMDYWFN